MKTMFAKEKTFNCIFPIHDYLKELTGDKKRVKIADVGAGMWSTTGSYLDGVDVKIYPSDAIADRFMNGLEEHGIRPLFPIEKQNMESLTYPDEMFDIVHCINALDHVKNPYKAIKEMYRVCKKGGWIYLRHHFNTARRQKERGLHHWNITLTIDLNCIFWGKLGNFLLSDCVEGFINLSKKEPKEERCSMLVSKLYKK